MRANCGRNAGGLCYRRHVDVANGQFGHTVGWSSCSLSERGLANWMVDGEKVGLQEQAPKTDIGFQGSADYGFIFLEQKSEIGRAHV